MKKQIVDRGAVEGEEPPVKPAEKNDRDKCDRGAVECGKANVRRTGEPTGCTI